MVLVQPPNFSNFKVIGGPNQSVGTSWINGKTFQKPLRIFYHLKKRSLEIAKLN